MLTAQPLQIGRFHEMARFVRYDPSAAARLALAASSSRASLHRLVEDLQLLALERPRALAAIAEYVHELARPIRAKYVKKTRGGGR